MEVDEELEPHRIQMIVKDLSKVLWAHWHDLQCKECTNNVTHLKLVKKEQSSKPKEEKPNEQPPDTKPGPYA